MVLLLATMRKIIVFFEGNWCLSSLLASWMSYWCNQEFIKMHKRTNRERLGFCRIMVFAGKKSRRFYGHITVVWSSWINYCLSFGIRDCISILIEKLIEHLWPEQKRTIRRPRDNIRLFVQLATFYFLSFFPRTNKF